MIHLKIKSFIKSYRHNLSNLLLQKTGAIEFCLIIICLFYATFFSIVGINKYKNLNSNYYDLGIMHQTVHNTFYGDFLELTNQDLKTNISRLSIHFDPIIALFAPLYLINDTPSTLIIVQAIIVTTGSIATFLLANLLLKKKLSFIIALMYLGYFPIQRSLLFDFHPTVLASPLILWLIYFQLTKKWKIFYFLLILVSLTKEHTGLIIILYGLFISIINKQYKHGIVTSIIGIIFFVCSMILISNNQQPRGRADGV